MGEEDGWDLLYSADFDSQKTSRLSLSRHGAGRWLGVSCAIGFLEERGGCVRFVSSGRYLEARTP